MRKSALIAATTVASFGVAAVAQAIEVNQSLTIKTTGSKGTATKPRALKLDVTTGTSAVDKSKDGTFGTKLVTIYFDRKLKFNSSKFPTCSFSTVATKPQNCKAGSKIGAGSATAVAGPGGAVKVNPKIAAYNDKNNKIHLKLIASPGDAVDSKAVLTGTLKSATGLFGKRLVVPIPAKLQNNSGLFVTINRFNTVITNKTYRGTPFVVSTGCTGGKYSFRGDFVLTDDTKDSVPTTSKC